MAGGFVFISGQIGAKADGSGIGRRLRRGADRAGVREPEGDSRGCRVEPRPLVKTTCFLSDLANFGAFNEIYRSHFGSDFPARSTFGVSLPAGVLVEVEAVATVG